MMTLNIKYLKTNLISRRIWICFLFLAGCQLHPIEPDDPNFSPVFPDYVKEEPARTGGLFQEAHPQFSLYSDEKARKVGDIITVVLSETTVSSVDAETKTTRDLSLIAPNPTVLGTTPKIGRVPSQLPLAAHHDLNLGLNLESNLNFDGKVDSNEQNSLTGTIAVTVTKIYPNGNLNVRGEKWIELARGKEYIRLSGIIRQQDVAADNTIPSSKVANARIAYSGTGFLINSTGPGWLMEALSVLWPF